MFRRKGAPGCMVRGGKRNDSRILCCLPSGFAVLSMSGGWLGFRMLPGRVLQKRIFSSKQSIYMCMYVCIYIYIALFEYAPVPGVWLSAAAPPNRISARSTSKPFLGLGLGGV